MDCANSNSGNAEKIKEANSEMELTEIEGNDHLKLNATGSKHSRNGKSTGGWKFASILLANQGLANLAFFGVSVNLVLFLTRVLQQDNAAAANNVSKWTGTVYLCSLIGAFLSDSYWGRYLTCGVFQVIFIVGLGLISISSKFLLIKPNNCGDGNIECLPPSPLATAIFYLSIYLVALGYGGHQPTLATFGADQFDEADPKEKISKKAFFAYFYFSLNVGMLFSNTVLVYFEDTGLWTVGFLASLGSAILALVAYLSGKSRYRYMQAYGNPLTRIAQVFVATVRKWNLAPAQEDALYEVEGPESAIKGSRKILHSHKFQFLDKAATATQEDMLGPRNSWRLCTVTQVEEAKCVLKLLPIWLCTIIYSVIFTQMISVFVEQGDVMHRTIGSFHIPAASVSVFDICSVLIVTGICKKYSEPLGKRVTGKPGGFTELQRMGIALVIGMLAMVAAGVTEMKRLNHVIPGERHSSLSIFWQIPQYVLVGASEVFMYVSLLEFFNEQAPDGIKSFGSSLCMASMSLGNYVSSMLVSVVTAITARGGNPGWIPSNLNEGHLDRFYFLIAGLAALDFGVYLYIAKWYKPINLKQGENDDSEAKAEQALGSV